MEKWTEAEELEAISLLKSGLTYREVASKINKPYKALDYKNNTKWHLDLMSYRGVKRVDVGWEDLALELLKSGLTYKEISNKINVPYYKIQQKNLSEWLFRKNPSNTWTELEDTKAINLLKNGYLCKEVALELNRSYSSILRRNNNKWHLILNSPKQQSERQKNRGNWAGKNNPNYGAKIVKRGIESPIMVWRKSNPGYQDGEKNPSFGRKYSPEEIEKKTRKMVERAKLRKGKTNKEVFGEERANEISRVMSLKSVIRLSKQKTSGTKPELKMRRILDSLNIKYEFQYPIEFYCVDFFIPDKNIVIQVDGCYWHGCPAHFKKLDKRQKNRLRLDQSCNSYLKNRGYKLIRVWECEIDRIDMKSQIETI